VEAAQGAVDTAIRLSELFALDRWCIEGATGRRAGSALRIHEALKARPLRSITDRAATTGLSFPAAAAAVDALVELGVAREFTGRRRDRLAREPMRVFVPRNRGAGQGTPGRCRPQASRSPITSSTTTSFSTLGPMLLSLVAKGGVRAIA